MKIKNIIPVTGPVITPEMIKYIRKYLSPDTELSTSQIKVGTQFFGWLAGLGSGAVIVSPDNIRREYVAFLKKTLRNYGEKYDGKI